MGEVGKRSPFQVDSGGVLMYCIDNRDSMSASSINLKTNTRISLERMPNRSHCRTNSTREDVILTIIVHPGELSLSLKSLAIPSIAKSIRPSAFRTSEVRTLNKGRMNGTRSLKGSCSNY